MLKKSVLLLSLMLSLLSCSTAMHLTEAVPHKNTPVTQEQKDDPKIAAVIAPYRAKMLQALDRKIAHTDLELSKSGDNSRLGNLLADYTLEGAQAYAKEKILPFTVDAAVLNIGGIRNSIAKGDITVRNVMEVMPFENELVIVKLKGEDLSGLLSYYDSTQKNNPVSAMYLDVSETTPQLKFKNGRLINPYEYYYIATSDYLALGGDRMDFFKKGEIISTGIKLRDLYLKIFESQKNIYGPDDVRLRFRPKK